MEYKRLHEIENLNLLEKLIQEGHDPNAYDSFGLTPLHYCENASVADYLVSRGADVLKKGINGLTPLEMCYNIKVRYVLLKHLARRSMK